MLVIDGGKFFRKDTSKGSMVPTGEEVKDDRKSSGPLPVQNLRLAITR